LRVSVVLWDYRTTSKKLTEKTSFWLVYGHEAIMPMEFILPSLCIETITELSDTGAIIERLTHLVLLEDDQFVARFYQQLHKSIENA